MYVPLATLANYCLGTPSGCLQSGLSEASLARRVNVIMRLRRGYRDHGLSSDQRRLRLCQCPLGQQADAKAGAASDVYTFVAIGKRIASNVDVGPRGVSRELL